MKSIIRFLKTKSLFFPFTIERNQKNKSKSLRLYKKFAKRFLKKTSLTNTFFNPFLFFSLKKEKKIKIAIL